MASGNKKTFQPELLAIYRLEFYKKHKNWKLSNEKTREITVPARELLKRESCSNLALSETCSVDQHSDVETTVKENTSLLNNALRHERTSDSVAELPPTQPTPQSTEGIWPGETSKHGSEPCQDIWMKHEVNSQQPISISNTQQPQQWINLSYHSHSNGTWTNRPPSHHLHSNGAWTNQAQPIDLQRLMETSSNHPGEWQLPTIGPPNRGVWTPTSVNPSPDIWPNNQKGPAAWINPVLLLTAQREHQNILKNQTWQKQTDINNKDQDLGTTMAEDVIDGEIGDDGVTGDDEVTLHLQPQHQFTNDVEDSPELVHKRTDHWLRRLLQVYWSDDRHDSAEQYPADDTMVEFIREAHGVPHSSEIDPSDFDECICSDMPVEALAGMSSARLAALLQHAANTLRNVLREQQIRDRLRERQASPLEEYLTHEADLCDREYLLSGSHVPSRDHQDRCG